MPLSRIDLLDRLTLIQPALADNELLEVLTHFWFTGGTVMAYNDQIAISVPLRTEFVGAVRGNLLLDLLKNSKARDVELVVTGDNQLEIKAASSRFKLATMPPDRFIHEQPEPGNDILPVKMDPFIKGIECCLRSIGNDTSISDQLGVTMIPNGKQLDLYSTNDRSFSYARVPLAKDPGFDRVILSTLFCRQLLRLAGTAKEAKLEILDDSALLTTNGHLQLFGKLIESDRQLDYAHIMKQSFPPSARKQMVPIPTKLKLVLERATVITEAGTDKSAFTSITVKERERNGAVQRIMRFMSKSDVGEVHDSIQIGDAHPDVSLDIEPRMLRSAFGSFDQMWFHEDVAVMAAGEDASMIYMAAAKSKA